MKCFIVLPCYNEEDNIQPLIKAIHRVLYDRISYEIIAVDDGSTDNTQKLIQQVSNDYPIRILKHNTNRGLATALQTGLNEAIKLSSAEDLIVTMDADNTHDPKYIVDMMRAAKEADIVIGSRYIANGRQLNVPFHRIILSKTANFLIKKTMKLPVKDATSGYRCFKASTLKKLSIISKHNFIESKGFEVSLEILAKAFYCNPTVKEVPIMLDYSRKESGSKMKMIPTIKRYLTLLLKTKAWVNKSKNES